MTPFSNIQVEKNVKKSELSTWGIGDECHGEQIEEHDSNKCLIPIISEEFDPQNKVPLAIIKLENNVKNPESSMWIVKKNNDDKQMTKAMGSKDRGSNKFTLLRISKEFYRQSAELVITPPSEVEAKKSKFLSPFIKNKDYGEEQVISNRKITSSSPDDHKVKKVLDLFHEIYTKVYEENARKSRVYKKGGDSKVHMDAAMILRQRYGWINTGKRIGHVPGIEIGDKFQWMTELNVIGLHRQFMNGIDYMDKDGIKIATSIVATARYSNHIKSSNTLIYSGQGGYPLFKSRGPDRDQKLEKGNLALKNSMEARSPVRVIRGIKKLRPSYFTIGKSGRKIGNSVYIYDGLYYVENYREQTEESGKIVFMFCLKRIPGQPELASVWASFAPKRRC